MGIIAFFKRLFSKNIMFKGDPKSHLVYVFKPKKGKVWFGKNIDVPEGMEFYFAKNGSVLDGFVKGEHEIEPMYLSKTIRYLKINKKKNKHKKLSFFVADGYFVSFLQTQPKSWKLFAKLEFFDPKYGYFKAMIEGKYIAQITNGRQFLKRLLTVYDYLKQGEAEAIMEGFVSETVYNALAKKDVRLSFLEERENLTDFLFDKLTESFKKSGVEILGFSVDKITYSKSLLRTIKKLETKVNEEKSLEEKIVSLNQNINQEIEGSAQYFQQVKQIEESNDFLQNVEVLEELGVSAVNESMEIGVIEPVEKKRLFVDKEELLTGDVKQSFSSEIKFEEERKIITEFGRGGFDESNDFKQKSLSVRQKLLLEPLENVSYKNGENQAGEPLSQKIDSKQDFLQSAEDKVCQICGEKNTFESVFCVLCGDKM